MKGIALYIAIGAVLTNVWTAKWQFDCPGERPELKVAILLTAIWPVLLLTNINAHWKGKPDVPGCTSQ